MARYPDLYCIGAQKAATSWLHRCLETHPGVFMPPVKEVHYFDNLHRPGGEAKRRRMAERSAAWRASLSGRIARLVPERLLPSPLARRVRRYDWFSDTAGRVDLDDEWYARQFAGAAPGAVCCDFTPTYALLPARGIAHLRSLSPDARIVYILRDPVRRAFSHARMLAVRRGLGFDEETLTRLALHRSSLAHGEYPAIIARWLEAFPPDRVLILFYDDVAARPLWLIEQVCTFAGLDFDPAWFPAAGEVVYRGPSVDMPEALRRALATRYAATIAEIRRRYPGRALDWGG